MKLFVLKSRRTSSPRCSAFVGCRSPFAEQNWIWGSGFQRCLLKINITTQTLPAIACGAIFTIISPKKKANLEYGPGKTPEKQSNHGLGFEKEFFIVAEGEISEGRTRSRTNGSRVSYPCRLNGKRWLKFAAQRFYSLIDIKMAIIKNRSIETGMSSGYSCARILDCLAHYQAWGRAGGERSPPASFLP